MEPLRDDNLVNTPLIVKCARLCNPGVAAAIAKLNELSTSPNNLRPQVLHAHMVRHLDAALAAFRTELTSKGHPVSQTSGVSFSRYLKRRGHIATDWKIQKIHRLLRGAHSSRLCSSSQSASTGDRINDTVLEEVLATLETIRRLSHAVVLLVPKFMTIRVSRSAITFRSKWNRKCRYCERPTEMQAFSEGQFVGEARTNKRYAPNRHFCSEHHPKKSSSNYETARRGEASFKRELDALEWASVRKGPRSAGNDEAMLYAFRRCIVDLKNLYLFDDGLLEEARALVRDGMTDRKKLVVAMLAFGIRAAEIARRLGISRAAVSKIIHGIPDRYRFDKAECFASFAR